MVPKVVAAPAGTNWPDEKHGTFTAVELHCLWTAVVGDARTVRNAMLFPRKLSLDVPSMTLKGKPAREKNGPETSQPPIGWFSRRVVALNGSYHTSLALRP